MPQSPQDAYVSAWARANRARINDASSDYPPPGDLKRRAACEWDLRKFCETYFPSAFSLAWSEDHLRVITQMQDAILTGGLFAMAMPRGSGKTTLSIRAALWALLYGHRRFVCLVASTEMLAKRMLKQFKTELSYNDDLAKDFRQVCHPIRRLDGETRRCIGQLWGEAHTQIEWTDDRLTFPTVPDSACDGFNVSGSTISVAGLTGSLRGQSHTLQDGRIIRPELVILDDPQTRESANSAHQSAERAAVIGGDVLGMAGPDQKITAIIPCTVIRKGDLADIMLDRKKSPRWKGIKCRLLLSMPTNMAMWQEYKRLRDESFQRSGNASEATAYYIANRPAMDAGAVAAWPVRFFDDEISAIQNAMNLYLDDPFMFAAEYQNEPMPAEDVAADELTADQIAGKINRLPRGLVPLNCSRVTAMIDIQATVLFYAVCAWEDDFTGYVIDYGTFPDQQVRRFTLRDAKRTLAQEFPGKGLEGQLYAGLDGLINLLMDREWRRDDGAGLRVDRCLIDHGWPPSDPIVFQVCRQSPYAGALTPSKGLGLGAGNVPMREWSRKPGDRVGLNWKVPVAEARREVRRAVFDANYWKSFVHTRLGTAMGDRGCLSIFGDDPASHRLFADHLTAEYRVRTEGRGRKLDEWKYRPNRPDNHWLDCIVGCAVGASIQGVSLQETTRASTSANRTRVSFKELQERARSRP